MFRLRDKVRIRNAGPEVYTIEEIRDVNGGKLYWIQLGADFGTRQWKRESEIELVEKAKNPESGPGFVPDRPIM